MGSFSIWHWLIVLLVVCLIFGTKKLRNLGSDLGNAVRSFKEGVKENPEDKLSTEPHEALKNGDSVIDLNAQHQTARRKHYD